MCNVHGRILIFKYYVELKQQFVLNGFLSSTILSLVLVDDLLGRE